ncbi:MAG: DUF2442 domain-containing protein [Coriobacteriales bacterium]|jgi:hypothetical protein|nr:DUF2442 domain-containing protein [Coriobacteriales bacterium]
MYIKDDIAYAGESEPLLKVIGVKAMDDYRLWLRFSNHEERLFDMEPLLAYPAFSKLQDPDLFKGVYLDYGVPTWGEGTIDVAPETLYEQSVQVMQSA